MHRFYLPPDQCHTELLRLTGGEAHHALHVLRVRVGEKAMVLDGAGREFLCEVNSLSRDAVQLDVVQKKLHPPLNCRITLLQAIPKGRLFESIVQKATELGAGRIIPILSERVVSKLDDQDAAHKTEKWRQVAVEALKQCGSPWLPQIEPPLSPAKFLLRGEKCDLPLVAALEGKSRHPRECFTAFQAQHHRRPDSVCLWVGPEGDFTPTELHDITSAGAYPITLGPRVLRVETAAIYCLSVVNYEMQSPAESKAGANDGMGAARSF